MAQIPQIHAFPFGDEDVRYEEDVLKEYVRRNFTLNRGVGLLHGRIEMRWQPNFQPSRRYNTRQPAGQSRLITQEEALNNAITYIPFGVSRVPRGYEGENTEINYMNTRFMGRFAAGLFKFHAFFQLLLASVPPVLARQSRAPKSFGVRCIFHAAGADWYNAMRVNFGTTQEDGQTLRPVWDNNVWEWNIMSPEINPYAVNDENVRVYSSTILTRGGDEELPDFLLRLKTSMLQNLPDAGDSKTFLNQYRLVQIFLVVLTPPLRGGCQEDMMKEMACNRAVFSPLTVKNWEGHCFWQSMLYSIWMRFQQNGSYALVCARSEYYGAISELLLKRKHYTRLQKVTLIQKYLPAFMSVVHLLFPDEPLAFVHVDQVARFSEPFGLMAPPIVVNVEGQTLVGDVSNVLESCHAQNKLLLFLHEQHYGVVESYTAFVVIKECHICHARFKKKEGLRDHLRGKICLKCVCDTTFQNEADYRYHIENREAECSLVASKLPPKRDATGNVRDEKTTAEDIKDEKYRLKSRFPHENKRQGDKHRQGLNYGQKHRNAMRLNEVFHDDTRMECNYQEALYFDLESIVPYNQSDECREEMKPQLAFACGWLRHSDLQQKVRPTLVYGENCIAVFMKYLDDWYDVIFAETTERFRGQLMTSLMDDAVPKNRNNYKNHAFRLKAMWETFITKHPSACLVCQKQLKLEDLTSHGFVMHGERLVPTACGIHHFTHTSAQQLFTCNNGTEKRPQIPIYAHNGGRYDWVFIHRYLMEEGRMGELNVVRANAKYIHLTYRDIFIFKDTMHFLAGSLENLGKNFQVETLKGMFPYTFVDNWDKIHMVLRTREEILEKLPPSYFKVTREVEGMAGMKKKETLSTEEYNEFMTERHWCYDVERETRMYLEDDILCLAQVWDKFRSGWSSLPNSPPLFKFSTIGQMCHAYFMENYMLPMSYPLLDVVEDSFIRRGVYGGRTEVFQRYTSAEKIFYLDVNSLYPYVMESRGLPFGEPTWYVDASVCPGVIESLHASPLKPRYHSVTEAFMEQKRMEINAGYFKGVGYLEVDVTCPQHLSIPVLPERQNHKNMFSLTPKTRGVYYSKELIVAIREGYTVTKIYQYGEWEERALYASVIQELKRQKLLGEGKDIHGNVIPGQAKNKSLREAAKIGSNSLYGKTLQHIQKSTVLVDNGKALWELLEDHSNRIKIEPVFRNRVSDVVEVTTESIDGTIQRMSNAAIGGAILAEARLVLYAYMEEVQNIEGSILYCDTDSIVYSGEQLLGEQFIDASRYGAMKVEMDYTTIAPGGFVALCPKTYALRMRDGTSYVRCKGISLAMNLVVENEMMAGITELLELMDMEENKELSDVQGINFDILNRLVRGEIHAIRTQNLQFLRTKDLRVKSYDCSKTMEDHFDKRLLLSFGQTVPWTPWNVQLKEKSHDFAFLSSYIRHGSPLEVLDFFHQHWGSPDHRGFFINFMQNFPGDFQLFYLQSAVDRYPQYTYMLVQ